MDALRRRLVMLMTLSFFVFAAAQSTTSSELVIGVTAALLLAMLTARYAVGIAAAPELTIGARAREHREPLSAMPEPQHPDTAGRPRTRAPSL